MKLKKNGMKTKRGEDSMNQIEQEIMENFERLTYLYTNGIIEVEEYTEGIESLLKYAIKNN